MAALFGRYEAAALLAVEQANGGELAPLEQVLMSFSGLFGSSVTPLTFSEAASLLVDARLVEWRDLCLGLTPRGRRLIRHSGAHWDQDFPAKVAAKLSELTEDDLAPEGELAAPGEQDVLAAMRALGHGSIGRSGPAPGEEIAPSTMARRDTMSARLLQGLGSRYGVSIDLPHLQGPADRPAAEPGAGSAEPATSEPGFLVPSEQVEEDEEAD